MTRDAQGMLGDEDVERLIEGQGRRPGLDLGAIVVAAMVSSNKKREQIRFESLVSHVMNC